MSNIIPEPEISLGTLAAHLDNAGWIVEQRERSLGLRSDAGFGFSLQLDTERGFINLYAYLSLNRHFDEPLELINRLNREVFLAGFSLDEDGDLRITYHLSYSRGLILPQFMRLIRRYASLIEHVRSDYNLDGQVFASAGDETETVTEVRVLQ